MPRDKNFPTVTTDGFQQVVGKTTNYLLLNNLVAVVGFDVSTVRPAVSLLGWDGDLLGYPAWNFAGRMEGRLSLWRPHVRHIANLGAAFFGMEDLRLRNIGVAEKIGYFRGIVREEIWNKCQVIVNDIAPATRLKAIGINKRPAKGQLKPAVINAINDLYGLELTKGQDDEADAIAVARALFLEVREALEEARPQKRKRRTRTR